MAKYNYAGPMQGTEQFIDRPDGTRLRAVSSGAGDRVAVLAHGYGLSARGWNLIADKLADEDFRVIAFDQRGHGDSTIGSDGVGSAQMASDYGAVLEEFDVSNAVLAGHSMGGFLALAFLLSENEATSRVGSLLLMGTFAGDVSRDNAQNRLQIPLIKYGILTRLVRLGPIAKAFTRSLVGNDFDEAMVHAFVPTFLNAQHSELVPILQAMVDENRYGMLGKLELPSTIVVGSEDKTTPPFHTADLHAGIAGSKLVTLPGIGHALNWEAPDEIAHEIIELANA